MFEIDLDGTVRHANPNFLLVLGKSFPREQAVGLAEVNAAVNAMDQVTQQNAAMVEQSTAASLALNGETADLAELVARFKVSDHSVDTPGPVQA